MNGYSLPFNTIWMYWHQGFDAAPMVVKKCVATWQRYHPQWKIHLLDGNNVWDFIEPTNVSPEKLAKLKLAHRSDLIRTQLLIRYGGVWADPTCYCLQPLESWLPQQMNAGVFLFARPGRDRVISNWFIASKKDNILLSTLYEALCRYWERYSIHASAGETNVGRLFSKLLNRAPATTRLWFTPLFTRLLRIAPYMVYHYKFYDLCETDRNCADIWAKMPKVSADGPHRLQRFGLMKQASDEQISTLCNGQPFQKLTWKINEQNISPGSVLAHLISRVD